MKSTCLLLVLALWFSLLVAPSPTRAEDGVAFGTEKSLVLNGRSSMLIWRNKYGVEIYSEELREHIGQYKVKGRMFWQFQEERLTGWGKVILDRRGGPETRRFVLEVYKELAQAEQDCQARGGHSVWIHSAAENLAVLALCDTTGYPGCQIGIVNPFTHWNNGDPLGYQNWHPTAHTGADGFADMRSSNDPSNWGIPGIWDDVGGNGSFPYICRLPASGDTSSATATSNL